MSSIIRMRSGVIGGLLLNVPAGKALALGSYSQQPRLMVFRLTAQPFSPTTVFDT